MATASSFITRALQKAKIRTAETAIEPNEMQDGLDALNDMLISWEQVMPLGFTPVADIDLEVRVPRYAHAAIKAELAIILGAEYSMPIDQVLAAEAEARKDELMIAIISIGEVEYPDTLPLGSGNSRRGYVNDYRFFPENEQDNF
jgi:hypothetical protein